MALCEISASGIIGAGQGYIRWIFGDYYRDPKRNGKLKGKQPKLPEPAWRSIRRRYAEGEVSLADLAVEYSVGRSTIHRIIHGAPETAR
ncbi:helix-turn-helix domain-containing protein [Streptosporangium canum]|uniref:helix-turn-helix domain-containing protein n=1 Tax=Streptosporangium canum TaxID=324952 RepID=UPI00343A4856